MYRTILHVEQEGSVKALVSALLQARGHQVDSTESGKEALEMVGLIGYDLIIVGDELTDIDGIGLIVKLRDALIDCPIVFVSRLWRDGAIYQQLKKDFRVDLVIHRPLKAGLLGAQIEGIFQDHKTLQSHIEQEDANLKTLQSNYLKILPQRVKRLEEAIKLSRTNPDDLYCLLDCIACAHNLKATAASCGFGVLGESAGQLEKALSIIKEDSLMTHEAAWEEIDLMVELVSANAHALSGNPTAMVDKRAFTTLEVAQEETLMPPARGPAIPDDNFDTFDDSSAVRVMVVAKQGVSQSRVQTNATGIKVQVIAATDREDALARASKLTLDAVLIDIDVSTPAPSLNLARDLRSISGYESLPVAFLSTSKQQQYIEDSTHAGASLMVAKSQTDATDGNSAIAADVLSEAIEYLVGARQGGRPRILIVDNDQDFVRLVSSVLGQEGMLVRVLPDTVNLLPVMQEFHPDLLLLDIHMPTVSGYDICRLVRSMPQYQDLPIIFLTALVGLETRLAAFESGGDDYLPKPVAKVELLTRVKVRLERSRMMKERSNCDVLSGLLIRRAFMEELVNMAEESERNGLIFSLALIDVDHFKKINDTHGHLAGDRVLAGFGNLLKRRFRVEDVRGRWGGEEFIVGFRHIPRDTAKGALQRALEELNKMQFEGDRGEIFNISFSAGIVSFPDDSKNIDELLKLADERLYKAKSAGRNCIFNS